jgi:regulator of sigma E protease
VPRAYSSKPIWQRNVTIFAGPFMNFVAAVVILFVFIQVGGIQKPSLTIAQVVKGSPAAAAGLQVGDRLIAANGATFKTWDTTTSFFEARPHKKVLLTYRTPSGAQRTVTVTLSTRPGVADQGFLGVGPKTTASYPAPWRAVGLAVTQSASLGGAIFKGLWLLVSGKINPVGPNGAAGPVGIISISQTAVRQSWYPVLLAFISVNLGIFNLLPFLPFDGGHIFFNVDGARARPAGRSTRARARHRDRRRGAGHALRPADLQRPPPHLPLRLTAAGGLLRPDGRRGTRRRVARDTPARGRQ